jgi:hypothetical protein
MPSTSIHPSVEPTHDQIAVVETLERRARDAFAELQEVARSVQELAKSGNYGAGRCDFGVDGGERRSQLADLKGLRVTGGREGFHEWWLYRVGMGSPLGAMVDDYCRSHRRQVMAIDLAVAAEDPELIAALDKSAGPSYVHDDEEYARLAGMTRVEVQDVQRR